jgi:predicted nucleic acid-binding protein
MSIDLTFIVDTFAWVELTRGRELAPQARATLERADRCLIPSIVLAEIAAICGRDRFPEETVNDGLGAIREASVILRIGARIARTGAHVTEELRARARGRRISLTGLADGLVLATARRSRSHLLNGDPHFFGCPETVRLGPIG